MKTLQILNNENTFEDNLAESNTARERWIEELSFDMYGRQKNREISKKWSRKIFSKALKITYNHAEITNSILVINILLQHKDCTFSEILGAFQLLLMDKIEQGKKVDINMGTDLDSLIQICENTKNLLTEYRLKN